MTYFCQRNRPLPFLLGVLFLSAPAHAASAATPTVAADFAVVIHALDPNRLTPYVSYVTTGQASGIKAADAKSSTMLVRTSDGKVLEGVDAAAALDFGNVNILSANPVSSPAFDPACYKAIAQRAAVWNNAPAVQFELQTTCNSSHGDNPFTVLYADPHTQLPIAAEAAKSAGAGSAAITLRYGQFAGRTMPTSLRVDVSGSGLLFWVHEHLLVTYNDYVFSAKDPTPDK